MRVRTLIFPFLLSLALVVLVPLYASADCTNPCGCGNCGMQQFTDPPCQCPGQDGCPNCATESDAMQLQTFTANGMAGTNSIVGSLTFTVAKLNVTERVMALMSGGKCLRDRVALSLLGNARESLKFIQVRFDEKNNILASLIEAEKAR